MMCFPDDSILGKNGQQHVSARDSSEVRLHGSRADDAFE
jgi:hypothetical protein